MAFEKGQSGNPGGRPKDKEFTAALRMELIAAGADQKALRKIAKNLISLAGKADPSALPAINAIADRLEGKPAQAVELSGGLNLSHEDALSELERPGAEDTAQTSG